MIVKNEEAVLTRALECLKIIADEFIIVDTGSSDRTKEIALAYAKNVYDFPWTDDFSAARNFACSKASMEFVYSADADEIIDDENQKRFLLLKLALLPEIDVVQMKYANQLKNNTVYNFDEEYRPKLFRRLRPIRWTSPIHEIVSLSPCVFDSDIVIIHSPAHANAKRDLLALLRASSAAPLDCRLHHMYATELFLAGDNDDFLDARIYFERSLSSESLCTDSIIESLCVVARATRLANDTNGFLKATLSIMLAGQPCAEICCELGEYFYSLKDWQESAIWFQMATNGAQSILSIRTSGDIPLTRLADCIENLGEHENAKELREKALSWQNPLAPLQ